MLTRVSLVLSICLAACGGSGSGTPDASSTGDAGPPSVRTVTCPPGVVPTITTMGSAEAGKYTPMSVTISAGGIVKFTMPAEHNVAPNVLKSTDPGLKVDFGATACLEFDKAGTFNFFCSAHMFPGFVTVQ
jgi:plastocyanin